MAYPLFKAMTRSPTLMGVPFTPMVLMGMVVGALGMWIHIGMYALAVPAWWIMAQITKHDDKAFRIWGLWFETKGRNRFKKFWGASTYSRTTYRKRK